MVHQTATMTVLAALLTAGTASRVSAQETAADLGSPPAARIDVTVEVSAGPDATPGLAAASAPAADALAEAPPPPGPPPGVDAVPPPPAAYYQSQPRVANATVQSQPVTQVWDEERLPGALVRGAADVDEESPSRAGRVAAEVGGGIAGFFLPGFVGAYLVCLGGCSDVGIGVAVTAALLGLPTGVWLAGNAVDGNGGWGWTLIGSLAGWVFAGGILAAGAGSDSAIPAVIAGMFPVAGAVVGYELSSDPSAEAAERRAARFTASFAPMPGGATLSVSGSL